MQHEQREIRVGDVVYLVSGSPELKVTRIDATVEWKNVDGEPRTGMFPIDALTRQVIPVETKHDL